MTIRTVRAVVKAYGDGKITLPKVSGDQGSRPDTWRYAPSFVLTVRSAEGSSELPYTAISIALFLGATNEKGKGVQPKIKAALAVLENIELGVWDSF